jgi:hypothetical protein
MSITGPAYCARACDTGAASLARAIAHKLGVYGHVDVIADRGGPRRQAERCTAEMAVCDELLFIVFGNRIVRAALECHEQGNRPRRSADCQVAGQKARIVGRLDKARAGKPNARVMRYVEQSAALHDRRDERLIRIEAGGVYRHSNVRIVRAIGRPIELGVDTVKAHSQVRMSDDFHG